jgi:Holliday junction resolvasome RuvABC ATP-dependent DNA helicase subunit
MFGSSLIRAHGRDKSQKLAEYAARAGEGDAIFIDEAHELEQRAQYTLQQLIDEHTVPMTKRRDGANVESNTSVAACSVILATDHPGRLLHSLVSRTQRVHIGLYPVAELREIVLAVAAKLGVLMTSRAATSAWPK